ncbi:thioredoxin-like protein [Mycena galericulata]|nr:thioredoxin-like protein [Mycena galericulata]
MAKRLVRLTIVNDLICPNCAVGQHELMAAITHCKEVLKLPLDFQIEDKFSQLQESIAKWGAEKGVPFSFHGVVSQSTRAHRLSRKAFHLGGMDMQLPFLMAIFRTHLQESKDVADINVLSDVAAEVGMMTKAEAIAFLRSDELEAEVNSMCDDARAKGITGWALSGGQSSEVFVQIFKKLAGVHVANSTPTFSPLVPPVSAVVV